MLRRDPCLVLDEHSLDDAHHPGRRRFGQASSVKTGLPGPGRRRFRPRRVPAAGRRRPAGRPRPLAGTGAVARRPGRFAGEPVRTPCRATTSAGCANSPNGRLCAVDPEAGGPGRLLRSRQADIGEVFRRCALPIRGTDRSDRPSYTGRSASSATRLSLTARSSGVRGSAPSRSTNRVLSSRSGWRQ